jgi:hypothetical protein
LGQITAYKDVPATVATFLNHTRHAHLTIAGACHDQRTAAELTHMATRSHGRILLHLQRVPPEQAGHLYAATHAAVCPYRTDGPFSFFVDVLHPSSVGTATGFSVPVIAPDLPAVAEMTEGRQRWLASVSGGLGPALADAEASWDANTQNGDPRSQRPGSDAACRWRRIADVYRQVAADLRPPPPRSQGDTPGA